MKRIRNFIAVMAIGVFLASCDKEDSNTGTGDAREKYTGSWTFDETSVQQGNSTYGVSITTDVTSSNKVIAKNFYNLGNNTNTVIVIDGNNMTIQSQFVSGYTLSGTGTYNNGNLTFNFSADDGVTVDQVSVT